MLLSEVFARPLSLSLSLSLSLPQVLDDKLRTGDIMEDGMTKVCTTQK